MKFHTEYNFFIKRRDLHGDAVPEGEIHQFGQGRREGQIVIPKGARELFGIQPGDQLLLMADKKRGIALVGMDDLSVPDSLFRLAKDADDDGNLET